jgi:hypothetical protein
MTLVVGCAISLAVGYWIGVFVARVEAERIDQRVARELEDKGRDV